MKKTLLTIALVSAVAFANAQNKMWLGGTISYSTESYDPDPEEFSSLVFGPNFGYMVNDKLAVGLGITYNSQSASNLNDGAGETYDATQTQLTFLPFVRMYKSLGEKVAIYGEFAIGIGSGSYSEEHSDGNDPDDQDFSTLSFNLSPGIQYWFADRWSINAQWGAIRYATRTDEDAAMDSNGDVVDAKTNDFSIGLDLSNMNFGLNYHF